MTLHDLQVLYSVGALSLALIGMKVVHDSLNSLADKYVSKAKPGHCKSVLEKVRVD